MSETPQAGVAVAVVIFVLFTWTARSRSPLRYQRECSRHRSILDRCNVSVDVENELAIRMMGLLILAGAACLVFGEFPDVKEGK